MKKFIQYARVSTDMQEYGIEVQFRKMDEYITKIGGITIEKYKEKESGGDKNRLQLKKAITSAKKNNAVLLVSKLDRLSRSVSEIFELKENGLDFIVAENPELNTMTLGIFATIAQHERELISERIKDGMKVAKDKGKIAGRPKGVKLAINHKKRISKSMTELYAELKDKIQEFADTHHDFILGDYYKLEKLMSVSGFKNRFGRNYTVTYLKRLGIKIGKVIKRKPGRKKKII